MGLVSEEEFGGCRMDPNGKYFKTKIHCLFISSCLLISVVLPFSVFGIIRQPIRMLTNDGTKSQNRYRDSVLYSGREEWN